MPLELDELDDDVGGFVLGGSEQDAPDKAVATEIEATRARV